MSLLIFKEDTKSLIENLNNVSDEKELNQLLIQTETLFFSLSDNYPSLYEIKELKANYFSFSTPLQAIPKRLTFLLEEFLKVIERRISLE